MMVVRPRMTNFKMTVRADCAVSACNPLPRSIKALAHWLAVGGAAFVQESAYTPRFPASKIKQAFLSTSLASLLAFEQRAAGPTFPNRFWFPAWGWALAISGSWVFPPRAAAMKTHWDGCEELRGRGSLDLPWERFGGDITSSCPNHLFRSSSLFPPCSALAANVRFSLVERKDASERADELQDQVSPVVCTRQTSLLSTKCYLGILPIGSDVCLTLRTVCVGKCT